MILHKMVDTNQDEIEATFKFVEEVHNNIVWLCGKFHL